MADTNDTQANNQQAVDAFAEVYKKGLINGFKSAMQTVVEWTNNLNTDEKVSSWANEVINKITSNQQTPSK